jgi:hypothetical protein
MLTAKCRKIVKEITKKKRIVVFPGFCFQFVTEYTKLLPLLQVERIMRIDGMSLSTATYWSKPPANW